VCAHKKEPRRQLDEIDARKAAEETTMETKAPPVAPPE
jgi:hypothetical protein